MGELVDHRDARLPCFDRLDIHLRQHDAAVLDWSQRHLLEAIDQRACLGPSVRFDETDDDVDALVAELMRVLEHAIALANTGSGADVQAEARAPFFLDARENGLGG